MINFLCGLNLIVNYRVLNNILGHEFIFSKIFPTTVANADIALKIYKKNETLVSAKTQQELKSALNDRKQIVLIYQMGKVGSTSYKKLLSRFSKFHVIHLHRLNLNSNDKRIQKEIENLSPYRALQERRWKEISLFIAKYKPLIHIVSGMRDPIARNISAYFENLEKSKLNRLRISELAYDFVQNYPHHIPMKWFHEQFKDALGIDIMNYPFEKESDVGNIEKKNFRCLLLNSESNESTKVNALNQFFEINLDHIKKENVGKDKYYSMHYKQFKEQIKLPESYLIKMYESEIVNHFYETDQIQKFYKIWKKVNT